MTTLNETSTETPEVEAPAAAASIPETGVLLQGSAKGTMKAAEATSRDLWMVHPDKLSVIPGFNVRNTDAKDYIEHIDMLAQSIATNGFYADKPLAAFVTKEGEIKVTDGHSRLAAIKKAIAELGAEIEAIPVVVKPQGTSMEDLTVALVKSNSGRPLTPLELAEVCKRLISFGWDDKKVADKLGFTARYVADLLYLLGTPAPIRKMVEQGKVSASLAIKEVKAHGVEAHERLKSAMAEAKDAGRDKVTAKHLDGSPTKERKKQSKAAKEKGPDMLTQFKEAVSYATRMRDPVLAIQWLKDWVNDDEEACTRLERARGWPPGSAGGRLPEAD
jgi:ParB-like chromosome segregation protein Spo0J